MAEMGVSMERSYSSKQGIFNGSRLLNFHFKGCMNSNKPSVPLPLIITSYAINRLQSIDHMIIPSYLKMYGTPNYKSIRTSRYTRT